MQRWHPASLTKLMTAYVAFRMIEAGTVTLDSPVRVSKNALRRPPSKMGFAAGSVMTLDNALKMLLVKSANDIAVAIAESLAGSEEAFVARMNAEAARLGMKDSRFANPHGLHDADQYVTARDIALLSRTIRLNYPAYADWFNHDGVTVGDRTIAGFNMLLGRFPGADGMKTGFVCASGFNQVGSATRNGRTLIGVVLGERSAIARTEHLAELLEKGFAGMQPLGPIDLAGAGMVSRPPLDGRETYCPKTAPGASEAGEPEELSSPLLAEKKGVLNPIRVGLGPANGPVPPEAVVFVVMGGVPIPTPRPAYQPVDRPLSEGFVLDGSVLRGTIPVPSPRPAG